MKLSVKGPQGSEEAFSEGATRYGGSIKVQSMKQGTEKEAIE